MPVLRAFRSFALLLAALLAAAPAAAISSATAEMILTMTYQGAFFTATNLGADNGTDYELEMFFNGVDNLPQLNTGVGSASSSGTVTLNGVAFDDQNFNLLDDGDVIVWTIDAAVTADGAGSSYSEFYQNNTEIFADIFGEEGDPLALTFIFDWNVVFNTTLNDDAVVGQTLAFTDGTAQGTQESGSFVLYTDYFDFGFGDLGDGIPTSPSGMDSGQLSFFTDDEETSLQIDLENSVLVIATVDVVPEPGTFLLLAAGLTGLAFTGRRRAQR